MRKHTIVLAVIAMMFAFSACQKDGVYNPKQKISEVYDEYSSSTVYQDYPEYNSTSSQPKSLSETWTWDKNLLMKITYPSSSGDNYVDFKYDGKRLSKAITNDGTTITYAYDGSKIDKINIEDDDFTGTYAHTYKGSKVSRIDITMKFFVEEDWDKNTKIQRLVLPSLVCDILAKTEKRMKRKAAKETIETYTITLDFEWDGDNVSKIKITEKGDDGSATAITTCTYDKNLNPFYDSPIFLGDLINTNSFSKNNLTKAVTTYPDETEEVNYTYVYDGKFPVKQINEETNIYNDEYMGTITSKYKFITHYVYK